MIIAVMETVSRITLFLLKSLIISCEGNIERVALQRNNGSPALGRLARSGLLSSRVF